MLRIKGGRVVDPSQGIDRVTDVWIDGGVVHSIPDPSDIESQEVQEGCDEINASGLVVIPGIIDMHVHLREPGYEYKETIQSGTEAAAAGGVTTVVCMANTNPVNDNGSVTGYIVRKAQEMGRVHVKPVGSVTKGLRGEELAEIGEMKEAGVVALSDDGRPVWDSLLMRRAMEYARTFDLVMISHCEDPDLSASGCMNEGKVSSELGLRGIPAAAEDIMVARDLVLAEWTGCPLHIAHVSTAGAVRLIRDAKARGIPVTAEATPHHLLLTEDAVRGWDTSTKVNPPLRSEKDVEALQEALQDGTIDVIVSDHAPHGLVDKQVEYERAASGISGLDTLLSLSLTMVHQGILSLDKFIAMTSIHPARILNISGGSLKSGQPADVTILDLDRVWRVDRRKLRSKGRHTPFDGWTVKGSAVMSLIEGRVVYEAEAS